MHTKTDLNHSNLLKVPKINSLLCISSSYYKTIPHKKSSKIVIITMKFHPLICINTYIIFCSKFNHLLSIHIFIKYFTYD